jgi:phosphopantothenoylcysteine decarboxylase
MNTHMYAHPFTSKHLRAAQDELGYLVLGPQGAGTLACGDEGEWKRECDDPPSLSLSFLQLQRRSGATLGCIVLTCCDSGPGKMTDWRDIVVTIQDFAALFRDRTTKSISETTQTSGDLKGKGHKNPSSSANTMGDSLRPSQPPRQSSEPAPSLQTLSYPYQLDRPSNVLNWIAEHDVDSESQSKGGRQNQSQDQNRHGDRKRVKQSRHQGLPVRFGIVGAEGPRAPTEERNREKTYSAMSVSEKEEYRVRNGDGGDGSVWSRNWWFP